MSGVDSFQKKSVATNFLKKREAVNNCAEKDFDEWSINLLPPLSFKVSVLDLGAGIGKQVHTFSKFFQSDSVFTALDLSDRSLIQLKKKYTSLPKLNCINLSYKDFFSGNINKNIYDLIYTFYALYYTDDLQRDIKKIYQLLKKAGIFWSVSPYDGTNDELFKIITKYYTLNPKVYYSVNQYYKDVIKYSRNQGFKNIKINILKNKVNFRSPTELMHYLENTTFYDNSYEKTIITDIKKVFKQEGNFGLSKNIISIQTTK